MAMAALRREGRRFATPLISPNPANVLRSSLIPSELVFFQSYTLYHVFLMYCIESVDSNESHCVWLLSRYVSLALLFLF